MNTRIAIAVLVAFIVFAVYSWYSTKNFDGFDINSQVYSAAPAPAPACAESPRIISPAGPGAPNERPEQKAFIVPPEEPYDPQEQTYESAEHPDRLRHPERAFGPGLEQSDVETPVAAGIASNYSNVTARANQVFGPEFAQNGGDFMDGVVASDSSMTTEYSSV